MERTEKLRLLSELLNDPDCCEIAEAEFQHRMDIILSKLKSTIEEYLKEVDRIRSEERKNMWTTTQESWVSQGRAEVCAKVSSIIDEITTRPSLSDASYDIIRRIKERKNQIIDGSISNEFRGRKYVYEQLYRLEGKYADALENEWTQAFYLGLISKDRLTEEQKQKLEEAHKEKLMRLCDGTYDGGRFWSDVLKTVYASPEERTVDAIKNLMPSKDNPHYDDIMDAITNK